MNESSTSRNFDRGADVIEITWQITRQLLLPLKAAGELNYFHVTYVCNVSIQYHASQYYTMYIFKLKQYFYKRKYGTEYPKEKLFLYSKSFFHSFVWLVPIDEFHHSKNAW
jgi:hypothetical protein